MIKKLSSHRERLVLMIKCIIFVYGILISSLGWSQGFNIYNPAEISQPWISDINPSVISSQYSRVSFGLKVFHFGFIPDKNFEIQESHINASFPFTLPFEIGIGGDLRYFSAGIYSELSSAVMLSRKVQNNLSLGIKLGIGRYGFSKQDFNLVDANDPLLEESLAKVALNLGIGAFWNPDRWSIGIGIDHLNRPDIGRQTNAILPREISAAVGYKFRNIMPAVLVHHDGIFARYGFAVSYNHERFGIFRFSFENTMPIKMEFQVNLSRDNSLQYGLDLPTEELSTVSMGSHEIVYNRILDRGPDIGQPKLTLSTNIMQIKAETIVRSMQPGLNHWQLENINELVPEFLEATGKSSNLLIIPTGKLSEYETSEIRKNRYAKLGKEVRNKLRQNPNLNLILQTDNNSLADARAIKHYLISNGIASSETIGIATVNSTGKAKLDGFEPGQRNESQAKPSCSVDKLAIDLTLSGKVRHVKDWKLRIINEKGKSIRIYKGKDRLPELMEWDWKNEWGELVTAGKYLCSLSVTSMKGTEKSTKSIPINISRLNRTVYLKFSQEPNLQASKIQP